jgi:beta-glucanase (GH16 family)
LAHRFSEKCRVREFQDTERLYLPKYGFISLKAKATISTNNVAALWMIGFEDKPEKSSEICIFEVKGKNIGPDSFKLGYGVHPFGDSRIVDQFFEEEIVGHVDEYNTYSVEWTPEFLVFYVNRNKKRMIEQSPDYEMQLMLNLYDLENRNSEKARFEIEYVAGYKQAVS